FLVTVWLQTGKLCRRLAVCWTQLLWKSVQFRRLKSSPRGKADPSGGERQVSAETGRLLPLPEMKPRSIPEMGVAQVTLERKFTREKRSKLPYVSVKAWIGVRNRLSCWTTEGVGSWPARWIVRQTNSSGLRQRSN